MIKIRIISVIKRPPVWVDDAVNEYGKRLSQVISLELVDVAPVKRSKNSSTDRILQQEATSILKALPENTLTIALDENGARMNTFQLAEELGNWIDLDQSVNFVIGGPDGLDPKIKSQAHAVWSLSDFTLPHAMVRIILVEQIYRSWCILKNHPYHRE